MVWNAKGLQVAPLVRPALPQRLYVIDLLRCYHPALSLAHGAQRALLQDKPVDALKLPPTYAHPSYQGLANTSNRMISSTTPPLGA